jgi:uncharacterized protein (DUF362 family)
MTPPAATVHTILADDLSALYPMAKQAAQVLGIHQGSDLAGRRVFIKPNLMSLGLGHPYDPYIGESTKAEIIVGIAEQCLQAGADKVSIGDGAQQVCWDWNSIVFFQNNRISGTRNLQEAVEWLRTRYPHQEIELLCLNETDEWEHIPSSSDHEIMKPGLKVARSFYEADHVISIPVLKTHLMADFSGSMKNLVGVTPLLPPYGSGFVRHQVHLAYADASSGGFENVGIAGCFTDILRWRKWAGREDFAIMDCSIGLEGTGPTIILDLGKPIDVKERNSAGKYFLMASKDFVALDATASMVMNHDAASVKQLRLAENLRLGLLDPIRIMGDATLEQLRIHDFEKAEQYQPEWGASEPLSPSPHDSSSQDESHVVNALAGFFLPVGAIGLLRHYSSRKSIGEDPKSDQGDSNPTQVVRSPARSRSVSTLFAGKSQSG